MIYSRGWISIHQTKNSFDLICNLRHKGVSSYRSVTICYNIPSDLFPLMLSIYDKSVGLCNILPQEVHFIRKENKEINLEQK